jgi:hypothetical protein
MKTIPIDANQCQSMPINDFPPMKTLHSTAISQVPVRWLLCVALLACPAARADEHVEDPDTEIARRHFQAGELFYNDRDYGAALDEFRAARRARALPALDYNIGRTLDRMERFGEAIDAYQSYVDAEPLAPDVAEVRARIEELRQRLNRSAVPAATAPMPKAVSRPSYAAAIAVGGGALVLAAVGAGLIASVDGDFNGYKTSCPAPCDETVWGGTRNKLYASYALLGLAGAAAVVDVVLWALTARRSRERPAQAALHWPEPFRIAF